MEEHRAISASGKADSEAGRRAAGPLVREWRNRLDESGHPLPLHGGVNRAGSGYLRALVKARLVPFAGSKDVAEDLRGADHVGEAVVQRRETEAHQVGGPEVADHAARYQRLHDSVAVRMREDDVAAPLLGIAR